MKVPFYSCGTPCLLFAAVVLLSAIGIPVTCSAQDTMREWSDATGRFKVTASLVSVVDGVATIRNSDGKTMRIPVAKLSAADQAFLNEDSNPFEMVEDAGAPTAPAATATPASGSGASTGAMGWSEPSTPNWDAARQVTIVNDVAWNVPVVSNALAFESKPVTLGPKSNFHERMHSMTVNPFCRRAALGYTVSFTVPQTMSRLTLVDLESGRAIAAEPVQADMRPLTLLDSGNDVLMVGNSDGRRDDGETKDQLQIWRVTGKSIQRTPSWVPYPKDKKDFGKIANADVLQAFPVNGNNLLTMSDKGHLVLWRIATREPIWHARLNERNFALAVSTDRKRLALVDDKTVAVMDLDSAQVLGSLSLDKGTTVGWPKLQWSEDGTRLLFTSNSDIRVLDVQSGQWAEEFALAKGPVATRGLSFPNNDYALLDDSLLVHLPTRIQVCQYSGASSISTIGGVSFIAVQAGDHGVFVSAEFPHPAAKAMLEKAQSDPTMFLVHPGCEVAIDVSGVSGQHRAEVQQGLEKSIADSGYKISAGSPIKVVATITGPKQEAVSYIAAGSYIVNKYESRVKLQWQGKDLWSRSSSNVPGILATKRGQTMQQALDEAGKKPNLSIFGSTRFPEFMQKPSENQGPGARSSTALMTSNFTTKGLVDSK
ncbi:SHD1 domain-containing protein [Stieleria varia]|uniref:SLA1 homology domain-containing protein n=1 Tax=Stieleria varia TaxID=2528005 RepID=A0A5C5ZZC6_9BACT|nr:SHD1 domain-containing protein [Stieleria varia]TWT92430.1 hypothetical protein Pla52n_63040 [Stieleria varia]